MSLHPHHNDYLEYLIRIVGTWFTLTVNLLARHIFKLFALSSFCFVFLYSPRVCLISTICTSCVIICPIYTRHQIYFFNPRLTLRKTGIISWSDIEEHCRLHCLVSFSNLQLSYCSIFLQQ